MKQRKQLFFQSVSKRFVLTGCFKYYKMLLPYKYAACIQNIAVFSIRPNVCYTVIAIHICLFLPLFFFPTQYCTFIYVTQMMWQLNISEHHLLSFVVARKVITAYCTCTQIMPKQSSKGGR